MHEINVTPFIDVMLVLLIIFYGGCAAGVMDVKVNHARFTSTPQPRPEKTGFCSCVESG